MPAEQVSRLSSLPVLSHDTIFATLRDRFFSSLTYTSLSDSILVSINPFAGSGNRNSDDTLREYAKQYRTTDRHLRGPRLPPHVFQLACEAYLYMQRTGQDQSISLA